MEYGKIPAGMNPIESKKFVSNFMKESEKASKPDKCILCGQEKTSFCNSHSVPAMCLKNIADGGKVLQSSILIGSIPIKEIIDVEKGIRNSGTFHFICNECDSKVFQDYENPDSWTEGTPTDKVLAQIALKDALRMLSKRNMEIHLWKRLAKLGDIYGIDDRKKCQELDKRDFEDDIKLYSGITTDTHEQFKVVFYEKLPYTVPIAAQVRLVLERDLEGNIINDIHDMSEDVRIPNLNISILPLKESTVVIMFYHSGGDKNYQNLRHQFDCLSHDKKLEKINYWVFKYTEDYFFSPKIKDVLDKDKKLSKLFQECYGVPNFGHFSNLADVIAALSYYKPVKSDEITNLLKRNNY